MTHHCFDPIKLVNNYPRGYKELQSIFSIFQPQDTVAWFKERGVGLHVEADGRMFHFPIKVRLLQAVLWNMQKNFLLS